MKTQKLQLETETQKTRERGYVMWSWKRGKIQDDSTQKYQQLVGFNAERDFDKDPTKILDGLELTLDALKSRLKTLGEKVTMNSVAKVRNLALLDLAKYGLKLLETGSERNPLVVAERIRWALGEVPVGLQVLTTNAGEVLTEQLLGTLTMHAWARKYGMSVVINSSKPEAAEPLQVVADLTAETTGQMVAAVAGESKATQTQLPSSLVLVNSEKREAS
jgi:hypothetical protein